MSPDRAKQEATPLRLFLADLPESIAHPEPDAIMQLAIDYGAALAEILDTLQQRGAVFEVDGAWHALTHCGVKAATRRGLDALFRTWIENVARTHGEAA